MTALDPELLEAALAELAARRMPKNDNFSKLIVLVFVAAATYAAFEARMRVVEDRYDQLKAVIIEMKDDLRVIRERQR